MITEEEKKLHSNMGNFFWYLRDSQWDIIDKIIETDEPFIECARRFGKTTSLLVYCLTYLSRNSNHVIRWISPWKFQCREIVIPEVDKIQALANANNKAKFISTDSFYLFPNGSKMFLRGANDDKLESARGPFANAIIADEFGFWKCPNEVESVLRPQLLTTRGKLIFASTPSKDLGHSYYNRRDQAKYEGRLVTKTIFDNESLTKEDIEKECHSQGGPKSDSWRREYLCEAVADSEQLVFPEFDDYNVVISIDRPTYYDCYVGADLGLNDHTGILFGFYNFEERTVYIEREYWENGKNSKQIADAAKIIEEQLWNLKKPYLRVSDNELQQLHDMSSIYGYSMVPTAKDDKLAAVNKVRTWMSSNRIKIHSDCKNLIFQCKVGLWNNTKTSFQRGDKTGHLDLLDALIYLVRNVNEHRNPTPKNAGLIASDSFLVDQTSEQHKTLKNIFQPSQFQPKRGL